MNFFKIIVVYSFPEDLNNLKEFHDNKKFIFVKFKNKPISKKWNRCINEVKKYKCDAVMILGSDDIITDNYLYACKLYIHHNYDYITNTVWTTLNLEDNTISEFRYIRRAFTDGLGSGRVISKRLLNILNYNLYNFNLDKGLDGNSYKLFEKHIKLIKYDILYYNIICIKEKSSDESITQKTHNYTNYSNYILNYYKDFNKISTVDDIYNINDYMKGDL